jgi:hypothetical protein
MTPAILFVTFNRPDTTTRVFEAIRAARPERLYVAADGPRPGRVGEAETCAEVRSIATSVDWPCEVKTLFHEHNLGCRRAVSGAITWFFENEPEGIILEDDCLPHPDFFPWCAAMIERYRDEPRVMCVTGNNFQADMADWPHDYYYSIYNHIWGWASWRRAWAAYDAELEGFDPAQARRVLSRQSRVPGFVEAWTHSFDSVRSGAVDTWDYQWTWSCWARDGLTCTPRVNLVSNIGFGPDATHTTEEGSPAANLPVFTLRPPYAAPVRLAAEKNYDDSVTRAHFGIRRRSLFRRVSDRFKKMLMPFGSSNKV